MKVDLKDEIWKPVVGYEGLYEVSNMGRVYSMPKEWICGKCSVNSHSGKILKQHKTTDGYLAVCLYVNNNSKTRRVHQLVAEAFLNHTPCGLALVIDHINDIKTDNRLDNLQIVTTRFNICKTQGKYSSKYKGVYWKKDRCKWRSSIKINGKAKHLGYFHCELKASEAYQQAIKELQKHV